MTRKSDVYRALLDHTLVVRDMSGLMEAGFSGLYLPQHAILRARHPELSRDVEESLRGSYRGFGCTGVPSKMPVDTSPAARMAALAEMLQQFPEAHYVLFEGYAVDSAHEHIAHNEAIRQKYGQHYSVILPPGNICDEWNSKPNFRAFALREYGVGIVTPGQVFNRPFNTGVSVNAVVMQAKDWIERYGKVVLKKPGTGGSGNLILHDRAVDAQEVHTFCADAEELLLEAWVEWKHSICVSFFIMPGGEIIPMEACEQILSARTGGFLGSTSITSLQNEDLNALHELLMPLVKRMAKGGMVGFMAIDVIIGDQFESPLHLPSGLSVMLIETNMRINGHNQDRIAVERIARSARVASSDVFHARLGARAVMATSREEAMIEFRRVLAGHATEMQSPELIPGQCYFWVGDNHGTQFPRPYDNIFTFGILGDRASSKMHDIQHALRSAGMLRE